MKVIICEASFRGHHLRYVSLLADYGSRQGWEVLLALSTEVIKSQQYLDLGLSKFPFKVLPTNTKQARLFLKQHQDAGLVFPNGDKFLAKYFFYSIGLPRPVIKPVFLLIRSKFASPRHVYVNLKQLVKRLIAELMNTSGIADVKKLGTLSQSKEDRSWVPDPVLMFSEFEVVRLHDSPKRRVLVVGVISRRKNLRLLVEALLISDVPDLELRVAGELDDSFSFEFHEITRSAVRRGLHITQRLELLSDQDLMTEIVNADVVAVLHSNAGTSGVLNLAAFFGVPAVAGGNKPLVEQASLLYDMDFPESISAAAVAHLIREVISRPPTIVRQNLATSEQFARSFFGSKL